jgi:hypothetical protein
MHQGRLSCAFGPAPRLSSFKGTRRLTERYGSMTIPPRCASLIRRLDDPVSITPQIPVPEIVGEDPRTCTIWSGFRPFCCITRRAEFAQSAESSQFVYVSDSSIGFASVCPSTMIVFGILPNSAASRVRTPTQLSLGFGLALSKRTPASLLSGLFGRTT